jgi:hypothetical protein
MGRAQQGIDVLLDPEQGVPNGVAHAADQEQRDPDQRCQIAGWRAEAGATALPAQ